MIRAQHDQIFPLTRSSKTRRILIMSENLALDEDAADNDFAMKDFLSGGLLASVCRQFRHRYHHMIFGKDSSLFSSGMLKVNIFSFMRNTNS